MPKAARALLRLQSAPGLDQICNLNLPVGCAQSFPPPLIHNSAASPFESAAAAAASPSQLASPARGPAISVFAHIHTSCSTEADFYFAGRTHSRHAAALFTCATRNVTPPRCVQFRAPYPSPEGDVTTKAMIH